MFKNARKPKRVNLAEEENTNFIIKTVRGN